jgi:hypothetical protein
MEFSERTPDYELEGWKEDSKHWLNQLKNTKDLSEERRNELKKDWQETLDNANAELERRKVQQSA